MATAAAQSIAAFPTVKDAIISPSAPPARLLGQLFEHSHKCGDIAWFDLHIGIGDLLRA